MEIKSKEKPFFTISKNAATYSLFAFFIIALMMIFFISLFWNSDKYRIIELLLVLIFGTLGLWLISFFILEKRFQSNPIFIFYEDYFIFKKTKHNPNTLKTIKYIIIESGRNSKHYIVISISNRNYKYSLQFIDSDFETIKSKLQKSIQYENVKCYEETKANFFNYFVD